jgi:hypothetical protein
MSGGRSLSRILHISLSAGTDLLGLAKTLTERALSQLASVTSGLVSLAAPCSAMSLSAL